VAGVDDRGVIAVARGADGEVGGTVTLGASARSVTVQLKQAA